MFNMSGFRLGRSCWRDRGQTLTSRMYSAYKFTGMWLVKVWFVVRSITQQRKTLALAHLLRLGILPTGTILPPEHRAIRDLARKRMQLVRSRTYWVTPLISIFLRATFHPHACPKAFGVAALDSRLHS